MFLSSPHSRSTTEITVYPRWQCATGDDNQRKGPARDGVGVITRELTEAVQAGRMARG